MADLTQDPAPAAATEAASEGYRPLSLTALVGFLLALLFVALVLVGGLAAFGGKHPRWLVVWLVVGLVGGWVTALFAQAPRPRDGRHRVGRPDDADRTLRPRDLLRNLPLAVALARLAPRRRRTPDVLAGVVAYRRLRRDVGGAGLARWGIGLVLFFSLNYGAYYLSSIYAVRAQGREATDEFLELLKASDKDPSKLYQAFARTMMNGSRPQITDLRRVVEVESNASQGVTGGAYSTFVLNTTVRLVQMFGEDAKYEKIGTAEEHDKGGYRVRVTYRVTGEMGTADFDLYAFGQESTDGGVVRRQWHIEVNPIPLQDIPNNLRTTEEGRGMIAATSSTRALAQAWLDSLTNHNTEGAYLATVAPDKHSPQVEAQVFLESGLYSLPGWLVGSTLKARLRPRRFRAQPAGLPRRLHPRGGRPLPARQNGQGPGPPGDHLPRAKIPHGGSLARDTRHPGAGRTDAVSPDGRHDRD